MGLAAASDSSDSMRLRLQTRSARASRTSISAEREVRSSDLSCRSERWSVPSCACIWWRSFGDSSSTSMMAVLTEEVEPVEEVEEEEEEPLGRLEGARTMSSRRLCWPRRKHGCIQTAEMSRHEPLGSRWKP